MFLHTPCLEIKWRKTSLSHRYVPVLVVKVNTRFISAKMRWFITRCGHGGRTEWSFVWVEQKVVHLFPFVSLSQCKWLKGSITHHYSDANSFYGLLSWLMDKDLELSFSLVRDYHLVWLVFGFVFWRSRHGPFSCISWMIYTTATILRM